MEDFFGIICGVTFLYQFWGDCFRLLSFGTCHEHRIELPLFQTEAIFDNLDTLKLDNLTQQALESEKLRCRFRSLYSK